MAVRIAPQLTRWSQARAAIERPSRYAGRTAAVLSAGTPGRRPLLLGGTWVITPAQGTTGPEPPRLRRWRERRRERLLGPASADGAKSPAGGEAH